MGPNANQETPPETLDESNEKELLDESHIKKVIEFKKSLDPYKTDVGAFLVEFNLISSLSDSQIIEHLLGIFQILS